MLVAFQQVLQRLWCTIVFQEERLKVEEPRAKRWGHVDARYCAEFLQCLPISSDESEQVCSCVSEFSDEHLRTVVLHGELNGLRCSLESRIHRVLLTSEVCELSEQSRP